jgi:hypothetical protein
MLCRLHLETPERTDLALCGDDLLDRCRPERTDHFVFKVLAASIEPEALGIASTRSRDQHACRYRAQKVSFFGKVVQARQPQPKPLHAKADGKRVRVRGAPDRQNDDAHGLEVQPNAGSQRLDRGLVAPAFDKHDRAGSGLGDDALRVIEAQRWAWPACEAVVQSRASHCRTSAQTFAIGASASKAALPFAFQARIAIAISSVSKIALCSRVICCRLAPVP